ncbi:Endoglucanase 1 [Bienertia sinuspersici]
MNFCWVLHGFIKLQATPRTNHTFSLMDDKKPGTKVLLAKDFLQERVQEFQVYKAHADNFICSLIPGNNE